MQLNKNNNHVKYDFFRRHIAHEQTPLSGILRTTLVLITPHSRLKQMHIRCFAGEQEILTVQDLISKPMI